MPLNACLQEESLVELRFFVPQTHQPSIEELEDEDTAEEKTPAQVSKRMAAYTKTCHGYAPRFALRCFNTVLPPKQGLSQAAVMLLPPLRLRIACSLPPGMPC